MSSDTTWHGRRALGLGDGPEPKTIETMTKIELQGTGFDKNPMAGRTLKVKRLTQEAKLPRRVRPTDAGYDLFYTGESPVIVPRGGHAIVPTGVAVEIPPGHVGLIRDRSGLASTQGLTVLGGVIDESYRGELLVVLHQTPGPIVRKTLDVSVYSADGSDDGWVDVHEVQQTENYQVNKGDRFAQLVVVPCFQGDVEEVQELSPSDRGDKGFGSSGK